MIEPLRAAVRPRVVLPETGDSVLLEDEVAEWLRGGSPTLGIVGGPGSGKTTALRHLAAVFGPLADVQWVDDVSSPADFLSLERTIYAAPVSLGGPGRVSLRLSAWSDDELLEYCFNRHRERCSSILTRCRAMTDRDRLEGIPQLWEIVLEGLAHDVTSSDWRTILADRLAATLPADLIRHGREYVHAIVAGYGVQPIGARQAPANAGWPVGSPPLLRHRAVQLLLAAANVVDALEQNGHPYFFAAKWPGELIDETARALASSPAAREQLVRVFARDVNEYQATAATLLHALGNGWRPPERTRAKLTGAVFAGAVWPQIDLSDAELDEVNLSGADLTAARLDSVQAGGSDFCRAALRRGCLTKANLSTARFRDADLEDAVAIRSRCARADFQRANLRRADFSQAELRGADFTGASLADAMLTGAYLSGAVFTDADLTGADLQRALLYQVRLCETTLFGARLAGATLVEADLEGVHFPDADFAHANLERAYLTGSVMPRADFRGAKLREAGLADVSWEGANLLGADLTNCSFHLGSSRSGLVGSPIACEGSRTGFYTDDFLEQDFKSPEEIRKADLRGTDLRGAIVDKTDFYLVDLRGAHYTPEQADHFRRCGAILVDRVQRT